MLQMVARRVGHVLLLLATLLAAASAHKLPQFIYSQSNKIMLSWDDVWEVGVSNKLAFLNKDNRLTIRINVEGGDTGGSMRKILHCRCSEGAAIVYIDLSTTTTQYCEDTMPFLLSKVADNGVDYLFTLMDSKLNYGTAFTQRIELSVQVEFSTGKLLSNSLFVHNLDAISKFGGESIHYPGSLIGPFAKRYLSPPAVNFLVKMSMASEIKFGNISFIDDNIINLIKGAPDYIRAKINIGAILQFDAGDCTKNFQSHLTSMFVNYYSKMNERNVNLLKHMGISLADGKLYYSTYGLSTAISAFYRERSPREIGICTITSFASHSQVYFKVDEVKQRIQPEADFYRQLGSRTSECSMVGTGVEKDVSIFAGMDYTPLVCPIICADPNMPYSFFHNGQQLVPDSGKEWTEINGIKVFKTANVIEFPSELFKRDSGAYKCEAGGKSFSFNVQIVGMPQFVTKLHGAAHNIVSGDLPPTVYAMENETLSYACSVYYTNLDNVKVTPRIFTTGASGATPTLREFTLYEFNSLFTSASSKVIEQNITKEESSTLNLSISSVPSAESYYLNFTHRVVCDASVSPKDAKKVGLPSYSVQSGSNVFFLKRPMLQNFNLIGARSCSEQKCSNKKGGYFEIALQPELTKQLQSIGVEVNAFFRLDNDHLSIIHSIQPSEISERNFDPDTNRLKLKINPIEDAILTKLQRYTTLTPVFNFRYSKVAEIRNLRMHKEQYGPPNLSGSTEDCRSDPRCFYSTDFDISSTLSGLAIEWNFIKEDGPIADTATASAGLISGVSLAAIIVIIAIVLLVLLLRRDTGETYMVDEKERQQGNHPDIEAKDEQFKEYQRPDEGPMNASRMSLQSNVSVESRDDHELDAYKDDDLDYTKFTEEGSFIGEYTDLEKQGSAGGKRRRDK